MPGQLGGTNDQFEEWWRNVTAEHCSNDRKKCNVVEGLVWGPVTTQGSGGGGNYWHHRGDWESFYLSLVVSFMVADHWWGTTGGGAGQAIQARQAAIRWHWC